MSAPLARSTSAHHRRPLVPLLLAGLLLGLSACGGGGSGNTDTASGASDPTQPSPPAASGGGNPQPQARTMAEALAQGDAAGLDLGVVMDATRTVLGQERAAVAASRQTVFGLTADGGASAGSLTGIDWDPSHDSAIFELLDRGRNHPLLLGNWRYKGTAAASGQVLAATGVDPASGSRYAAFGGNPLAVRGNAAMDAVMKNTISWLTGRSTLSGMKVVTAHLPSTSTYWFKHEKPTRDWLIAQLSGVSINGVPGASAVDDACDGPALDGCLQGADLLVMGREENPDTGASHYDGPQVMSAVKAAQARGVPVLYLHHNGDAGDLATRMLDHLGLGIHDNYWDEEGLKALDPSTQAVDTTLAQVQALLDRLAQNTFSTTFTGCYTRTGKVSCENDTTLQDEFVTPAIDIRTGLRSLDAQGVALFDKPGYALEKHLVLLGDKYREAVVYPMDKVTDRAAFFRAQFSDMTAYINRRTNAVAANQGSFAAAIAPSTPVVTRTVSTTAPLKGTREYLTGLYVMPGRTVTLTRTDAVATTVSLGINLLRDTTRVYNPGGYDRPSLLSSPHVPLVSGHSVTITSPFGGPLILFVSAADGAPSVTVQVEGVTTHPVLRNMRDAAEVAAFKAELSSTPTNWVGVSTDFLTVHSTVEHFRATLAAHQDDMNLLADRLWTYMVKDTYELAGFNTASGAFGLPASVSAFCASAGWDCTGLQHRRDVMQHVIVDTVALCGSGCSGNPYDQSWALEPLGWGETHEIGHNLQRSRLSIYGSQSGEVSNNIFPMHKQIVFNRATSPAVPMTARRGSTKEAFDLLKASLQPGASATLAYTSLWSDTAYSANNSLRLNFYRQLVEFARHYNSGFSDGWELYTLAYLLERNFDASSANWASVKDSLGFGTYATYPGSISGNDFLLIGTSRIIGRDMGPVFSLWGVTTSDAARAQVAAYGYAAAEPLLFPMDQLNAFGSGVGAPILMSATVSYPVGY